MKYSLLILFFAFILVNPLLGSIPREITWQGILTDLSDNPLSGNYNITFRLFDTDDPDMDIPLWEETKNLNIENGFVNVVLGENSLNSLYLLFNERYWLEVQVGANPPMNRIKLTSVPTALMSKSVEDSAIVASKILSNTVVRSIGKDYPIMDHVRLVEGDNITIEDLIVGENGIKISASSDITTEVSVDSVVSINVKNKVTGESFQLARIDTLGNTFIHNNLSLNKTLKVYNEMDFKGIILDPNEGLSILNPSGQLVTKFNYDGTSLHKGLETFEGGILVTLDGGGNLQLNNSGFSITDNANNQKYFINPNGNVYSYSREFLYGGIEVEDGISHPTSGAGFYRIGSDGVSMYDPDGNLAYLLDQYGNTFSKGLQEFEGGVTVPTQGGGKVVINENGITIYDSANNVLVAFAHDGESYHVADETYLGQIIANGGIRVPLDGGGECLIASDGIEYKDNLGNTKLKINPDGSILHSGLAQFTAGVDINTNDVVVSDADLIVANGGNVNVSDGNFNLSNGAIELIEGALNTTDSELNMTGGSFQLSSGTLDLVSGSLNTTSSSINMSGGSFQLSSGALNLVSGALNTSGSNINMTGGTFQVSSGTLDLVSGSLNTTDSELNMTGGGFNLNSSTLDLLQGTLNVTDANSTFSGGTVSFNSPVTFIDSTIFQGIIVHSGIVTFDGETTFTDSVSILDDSFFGGNINVIGTVSILDDSFFGANINLNDKISVADSVSILDDSFFGGNINVSGKVSIFDDSFFGANVNLNDKISVADSVSIFDDSFFGGNVNLNDKISVADSVSIFDDSFFGGNINVSGKVSIFDDSFFGSNMEVTGNVTAAAFIESSDENLKRDFSLIENISDKINNINVYSYYWKDAEKGTRKQIGFKAQEIEQAFPELVETMSNGYKGVMYSRMAALLLQAYKEQSNTVETLKKQIAELIKKISEMENQNADIENMKKEIDLLKMMFEKLSKSTN